MLVSVASAPHRSSSIPRENASRVSTPNPNPASSDLPLLKFCDFAQSPFSVPNDAEADFIANYFLDSALLDPAPIPSSSYLNLPLRPSSTDFRTLPNFRDPHIPNFDNLSRPQPRFSPAFRSMPPLTSNVSQNPQRSSPGISQSPLINLSSTPPFEPSSAVCKYYLSQKCYAGPNCRFRHVDPVTAAQLMQQSTSSMPLLSSPNSSAASMSPSSISSLLNSTQAHMTPEVYWPYFYSTPPSSPINFAHQNKSYPSSALLMPPVNPITGETFFPTHVPPQLRPDILSRPLCRYYRDGKCQYGVYCRFAHY